MLLTPASLKPVDCRTTLGVAPLAQDIVKFTVKFAGIQRCEHPFPANVTVTLTFNPPARDWSHRLPLIIESPSFMSVLRAAGVPCECPAAPSRGHGHCYCPGPSVPPSFGMTGVVRAAPLVRVNAKITVTKPHVRVFGDSIRHF